MSSLALTVGVARRSLLLVCLALLACGKSSHHAPVSPLDTIAPLVIAGPYLTVSPNPSAPPVGVKVVVA